MTKEVRVRNHNRWKDADVFLTGNNDDTTNDNNNIDNDISNHNHDTWALRGDPAKKHGDAIDTRIHTF